MTDMIEFDNVSIVFGDKPKTALPLMDHNLSREEIKTRTGQILGVHNCNLSVAEGEISVLMGLSGSGKSTLLRAVNGLNKVTRGRMLIRGKTGMNDIATVSDAALREIRTRDVSMVFQSFGLLPWRTVADNVAFGLEVAGQDAATRRARAMQELERVNLTQWADRMVSELSGGMRQRVGLARAFATDAPILLMDEPFSALDPLIRAKLQDELLELQASVKRTILFVSHDLEEAVKIGDHIAIMEGGRIVQHGTPEDIILKPSNAYVAEFVAHLNPLPVMRAIDAMQHGSQRAGEEVDSMARVTELIARLTATQERMTVVENGKVIGTLGASDVLSRLARR
jgi:glycine betaine/proline transport system ATP-binding protein